MTPFRGRKGKGQGQEAA